MEAVMEQYAIHEGRIIDLDIEHVMTYVADRDYSDPLFDQAFWCIVETYFKDEIPRVTVRKHVVELIERDSDHLAAYLAKEMGITMIVVPRTDERFPTNLDEWFDGVEFGCVIIHSKFGTTQMAPGASRSHAIVMAMMQYARELSGMHLNPEDISGVLKH